MTRVRVSMRILFMAIVRKFQTFYSTGDLLRDVIKFVYNDTKLLVVSPIDDLFFNYDDVIFDSP